MRAFIAISVLLFSFTQMACRKTTMVAGVITDNATGKPIEGVKILLAANKNGIDHDIDIDDDEALTDSDGRYALEVSGKRIQYVFIRISKEGFITPPNYYLENGDCIGYSRPIHPFDAYLSIKFINQTGASKLYCTITGDFYEGNKETIAGYNNPVSIPLNDSLTQVTKIAGGEFSRILWDIKTSGGVLPANANTDSIFCSRNDTTYYILHY